MFLALSTLPGGLYVLIERGILRSNTAVMGARYVLESDLLASQPENGDEEVTNLRPTVFGYLSCSGLKRSRPIGQTHTSGSRVYCFSERCAGTSVD